MTSGALRLIPFAFRCVIFESDADNRIGNGTRPALEKRSALSGETLNGRLLLLRDKGGRSQQIRC